MGDTLEVSRRHPPPPTTADRELQERLKSHARAFEGLMSLIPAKDYYGKDESITSVSLHQHPGAEFALTLSADAMAEEEEAVARGTPGSQASKAGPCLTQVGQGRNGRERAQAKARVGGRLVG